jgi:hypothetical protein
MTATQRHAWFSLAVVAATIVAVLALTPVLGPRAQVAFALLALLALGPLFVRRKHREVPVDERDRAIGQRAGMIAYAVFWLAFVAACLSLPVLYGWGGSVPVVVVQAAVWWAWILVVGARSAVTLVLYQLGSGDAA